MTIGQEQLMKLKRGVASRRAPDNLGWRIIYVCFNLLQMAILAICVLIAVL